MAQLTAQTLSGQGAAITEDAASAGGDVFDFDRDLILEVRHTNGAGSATTVTLASQVANPAVGLASADVVVNIAAGAKVAIDMARADNLVDANDQVQISYANAADLVVSLLKKQA